MRLKGVVRKGTVVLEKELAVEDGTQVEIEVPDVRVKSRTLEDVFKDVAGKAVGLPRDMARNHDHCLHGMPKRKKK